MTQMKLFPLNSKMKLSIFFLCISTIGQTQDLIENYTKKYPGHHEIVISDIQKYYISYQKDKLKVLEDCYVETLILTEIGARNVTESFTFSELVPLNSYHGYTILSKNGKDKKIPLQGTVDKLARENSVFYNDVMEKKLTFSNLEIGAKKVYHYQSEFLDPNLLHRHIFADNRPVKNSTFEITTDEGIEMGYVVVNDPMDQIQFEKTTKRGKNIYTWQKNDLNPLKFEPNNPGFLHIAPHVVIYVKSYMQNQKKIDVLGNVDLLYQYYRSFTKNINQKADEALKEKTISLVHDLKTEEEKIKAIFYWVKNNIKYVAFENGYEGFIPREAKLVFERKFGDCKDMSSIITEMAKYAQIPNVNLCWIGTRRIPYTYEQVPTPAVDDHMIACIEIDGKIIFLDATDSYTKYGLPSGFIQGKEALIAQGDSYKIVQVPIVNATENLQHEFVKMTLNNLKLIGKGTLAMDGLSRSHYISQIGDATQKVRFERIKSLVTKGNNKFQLLDYSEKNIENKDIKYIVDYTFELDNFLVESNQKIYLSLFLNKPFEKSNIEKDRVAKYEMDQLVLNHYEYEIELPINLTIEFLPENVHFENSVVKFDAVYQFKNNNLSLDFTIENKKMLLDVSDFEPWNEAIKNLKNLYNETIVLVKK